MRLYKEYFKEGDMQMFACGFSSNVSKDIFDKVRKKNLISVLPNKNHSAIFTLA